MRNYSKVIFIMTDTQRWDMCGCYRNTGLQTPNIDRLAGRGMRFERAYTTQPVCQPARAAIFTGQYPHACGSWANSMGISDNTRTLGQRLFDNGVHTAYVGKWHLDGGDYFGTGQCPPGWDVDYWYDMRCYLEELTPEERAASRRTETMLKRDFPAEMAYGHRCANRALHFLENHAAESFFLAVSFDEPHDPFLCPKPYNGMYKDYVFPKSPNIRDTLADKPDYQRVWAGESLYEDKERLTIRQPHYFGCNSYIDHEIGRVLDAAARFAPDALIIYTSDHGDFLHAHSLSGKGPAAYDEITRIPLIIAGPGIPAGAVNPNPVSHINLAPTVMQLMGFDVPKVMDGPGIVPELAAPHRRVNPYIFIEFGRYEVDHDGFGGYQPMRCAFDGRLKLSVNLMSSDELYDVASDPDELINLIEEPAWFADRDRLHDAILRNMDATRDPFRGYYWERRPWRKNAAKPTWGYTGMTRQREEEEKYERRQLDYGTGLTMEKAVRKKA